VIIAVGIPRSLTEEQRELFQSLANTLGTEVHPQERSFMDALRDLLGGLAD
jgi:molecular chaperone DnaJ